MRKFIKTLALATVAVVGVVSCTGNMVDDNIKPSISEGVTLYAYTPSSDTSTRVEFAESEEDNSISLSWSAGDSFVLYDSDDETTPVDTFTTVSGDGSFDSSLADLSLTEGKTYIAKYNEGADPANQNGDQINNLDAACHMEAKFVYGEDSSIVFEHQMAIMTFKFISEERPAKLVFENGEDMDIYTVTYSEIEADAVTGIYTSHIMIYPFEAIERTLTFSLYAADESQEDGVATEAYDIRTTETTKAYVAGKRYTASVSNLENSVWSGKGTSDEPYQIENATQLHALSTSVNSGSSYSGEYFELVGNINLGGIDDDGNGIEGSEFTPIGNAWSYAFQGTFDGGGFEISGLYVSSGDYAGLFGVLNGATIRDLGVSGSVTGSGFIGGIAGYSKGSDTIINCYNKAIVTGSFYVGGIAGCSSYRSNIINCYNMGAITSTSSHEGSAGGIVGCGDMTIITACYNVGAMSGAYTGGIVGFSDMEVYTSNCYWNSDLSGTSYGIGGWNGSNSGAAAKSSIEMQADDFVTLLNNGAATYNETEPTILACAWTAVAESYPTLNLYSTPTYVPITAFSGGYGTETEPYQISSAEDLRTLADDVNINGEKYSGSYFEMTTDINLGGESSEFTAIGNRGTYSFQGIFDGGGYEVSGLYINQSSSDSYCQGLFGWISGATIKNLGVSGSVTGYTYVGGVVGYVSESSTVENCYNTASVTGNSEYTAGVAGKNDHSTVINCYNTGDVEGTRCVAGIVGDVNASNGVATVVNCYNTGSIKGSSDSVGGVVGTNYAGATTTNCYNSGSVEGGSMVGGVVGQNLGNCVVNTCYYNSDVYEGDAIGSNGGSIDDVTTGLSTSDMQAASFAATLNNNAYDYNEAAGDEATQACAWVATSSYPALDFEGTPSYTEIAEGSWADNAATSFVEGEYSSETTSYTIETAEQAAYLATLVNGGTTMSGVTFTLTDNISLSAHEWTPIGSTYSNAFKGTFDGGGCEISGLYVTGSEAAGLFGFTSGATIKDLGVSGSVTGTMYAGGVTGYLIGTTTIINCYNNATVTGAYSVGGIVGRSEYNGNIINCYNMGTITMSGSSSGDDDYWFMDEMMGVGGIVGSSDGTIKACYNVGAISGTYSGGIAGSSWSDFISKCYWDSELSGTSYGIGGWESSNNGASPKSSIEMQADDFVIQFNNIAYTYNVAVGADAAQACAWVTTSSYPTHNFDAAPSYTAVQLFTGGSGTENDPYQMSTASDLLNLATSVADSDTYLGMYFKMTGNINLENSEFTAIGSSSSSSFQGTFDGGGYEVSGLYINQSSSSNQGLFGYISNATIKNLGVSGSVTGNQSVGGVVGFATSSTIENCYNTATIVGSSSYIGGVVGKIEPTLVINCYNTGDVEGARCVGGITGDSNGATSAVINCYNTAAIKGTDDCISGIVGCNINAASTTNCYNSGTVEGATSVGAIVGKNYSSCPVATCYYNSDVYSGSAVGSNSGSIDDVTTGLSTSEMKAASFVVTLNNNACDYNEANSTATQACAWEAVTSGYPTLDFEGEPSYTESDFADNIEFVDAAFKAALVADTSINTNGDDEISYDEASAATTISVSSSNISSMAELKYFTNLTTLYCNGNNLTELDVSYNTELTYLNCNTNSLIGLDVSNNTNLTSLSCYSNSLSTLDVSNNTKLTSLNCHSNSLSTLDVSNNTNLETLSCYSNSLSTLDVSYNVELTILSCSENSLTELTLSANTELMLLDCSDNMLTSLDVSNCSCIWESEIVFQEWNEICERIWQTSDYLTLYVSNDQWNNGLTPSLYEYYFAYSSGQLSVETKN